jgi:predicted outer membrane protein
LLVCEANNEEERVMSRGLHLIAAGIVAAGMSTTAMADRTTAKPTTNATLAQANKVLSAWEPGPQLAGQEMIAKYGAPQEVTSERMIWHHAGPYKRITLTREQLPHDFPMPHMDYLEHTISYNVPPDKTDDVHAFDASITIYRVPGELSARCDLESNNVLTLNLAKDVIDGKKSVEAARKEFGDAVMARTLGKNPPVTAMLQFKPQQDSAAADLETATLPGAPKRVATAGDADGETLAMLTTLDLDEVHAAMVAKEKRPPQAILDYATMLHEHHGKHVQDTSMLGMKAKVAGQQTPAVQALHAKNAGALAKIVPLQGDAFGRAYVDLMIKGHADALALIDQRMAATRSDAIKSHLRDTRAAIASHLEQAKQLRANAPGMRTSSR